MGGRAGGGSLADEEPLNEGSHGGVVCGKPQSRGPC